MTMTDDLLAYLLDDLSPDQKAEVERRLAEEPAWRRELARLEACLAAGGDRGQCCDEPPTDLVTRTCCLVERVGDEPVCSAPAVVPAFTPVAACSLGASMRWSLADLTVGGGVLLALAWLMIPALRQNREVARQMACQNNMRALGTALFDYQDVRGGKLPAMALGDTAGVYAAELLDKGVYSREELEQMLLCPASQAADDICNGRRRFAIPSVEQLRGARGPELAQLIAAMRGIYAVRVGYMGPEGYQALVFTGGREVMLADEPSDSAPGLGSANHEGGGQNVLFQHLGAEYRPSCLLTRGDNLYLNEEQQPAVGRSPSDVVTIRSVA